MSRLPPPRPRSRPPLRLLSDPYGSIIQIDGQPYTTPAEVSLPVGDHHFAFEGGGWSTACDEDIVEGVTRLKFTREKHGCVVF